MMRRALGLTLLLLAAACAAPGRGAAQGSPDALADYELRLEEIAREVAAIRAELETLVVEVVEGESGRAFVFLERPVAEWKQGGVTLVLNGQRVFSRPFTPAELDVLDRGLPLELGHWRLPAGEHRVVLGPLGKDPSGEASMTVTRGAVSAWIAVPTEGGVEWRIE